MRHISRYHGLVTEAERALGDALVLVALRHMNEPDIREGAQLLSSWSEGHIQTLRPAIAQFGKDRTGDSERLRAALFRGRRWSAFGLLRDLHDLALLAEHVHACWTVLVQCAKEFRDARLQHVCEQCAADTSRQRSWLDTKIRHTAPQAVLVAADPARELLSAVPTRAAVRRLLPVAGSSVLRRLLPWASSTLVSRAGAALLRPRPTNRIRQALGSTITGVAAAILLAGLGHRVLAFMPPSEKSLTTSRMRIR